MKRVIAFILFISCAVVHAQTTSHFELHHENDLLNQFSTNKDKYYSAGQSFSYVKESDSLRESFTLGQLIYTPSAKRIDADPEVLKNDRGYGGWLYVEYRHSLFTSPTLKDTYGIQVGCTGRCSLAKEAQTTVHKLIGDKIPTWDPNYVMRSEPGFILELERNYYPEALTSKYADASFYAAGKAGTIIDSVAGGIDLRLGYNLPRFASEPIIFKTPRGTAPAASRVKPNLFTAYVFARGEERFVAFNSMLHGSMFQEERHRVTPELFVMESNIGFTAGYGIYKVTYRVTTLSSEWTEHKGAQAFGGIDLSF
jgi:hypothetical protein